MGKIREYLILLLSLSLSEVPTPCSAHVLLLIFCDHGNGDEESEVYGGEKKNKLLQSTKVPSFKSRRSCGGPGSSIAVMELLL